MVMGLELKGDEGGGGVYILRFVGSTGLYWILDAWMDVLSVHSVGEYDDNSFRDTERTIVMQYSSRSILHLCRITN